MVTEKMEMEDLDSTLMKKGKEPPVYEPRNKYERLYQPCLAEMENQTFALTLVFAVSSSGSHFNPPFTIAIYLCGGIELMMVGPYLVSQLIGGVLGAGMAKLISPIERYNNVTGAAFDILKSERQLSRAIFGEVAMTCLVTMVLLLAAVNGKTKTPMAPFLIGCTVLINILAGADISGSCLNPARAFGPALMTNYWAYHWVYWVGPIGGGVLAAVLVRLTLGDNKLRVVMKS
ncbi:aquaporin-8a.2 isoform 2-T2 [Menidia menidia]